MNEGVGGSLILSLIVVFMVFVLSYMAFNVNYTKAFRLKNKVISEYEKYNGACNDACKQDIQKYANSIGYNVQDRLHCDKYFKADNIVSVQAVSNLYCVYKIRAYKSDYNHSVVADSGDPYYFKILTRTNISIPIVQNALPIQVLNSTGDTKVFDMS